MDANQVLSRIQLSLSRALSYFLVGSVSGPAGFLSYRNFGFVNSGPLRSCISAFRAMPVNFNKSILEIKERFISVRKYAHILSVLNDRWDVFQQNELSKHANDLETFVINNGQSYASWLDAGGNNQRYWPVHQLMHILKYDGNIFFRRGVVHGSIATLDDTEGFSDMDLAFIINKNVLKNDKSLLKLRKLSVNILILTYAFDPYMHHGPEFISEIDLCWYPQSRFPLLLFEIGVDILSPVTMHCVNVRPSLDLTDEIILDFEKYFEKWSSKKFFIKNNYDAEWLLGSAMLLPALYLQRVTGIYRYKGNIFEIAKKDFLENDWKSIETASILRSSLGPRPKPSKAFVRFVQMIRFPILLHLWGKFHPLSIRRGKYVSNKIGDNFPEQVLHLINVMKQKIKKTQEETTNDSKEA